MPTRQEMWGRLGDEVDVLVVGGGINGAGIARDAARRGLRVALVDMNDLAFGTSSRSSKLVHGGLRYLEQLEFSLVFEAVSERRILMDIAPHLVNPLGFLFPVYKGSRRRLATINAGMWLYDGLALFRAPRRHRKLSVKDVKREEPVLGTERLTGAPLYYDCSTDDARLTLESALDAAHVGAIVCTYAKVVSFTKDEHGRVTGAVVDGGLGGGLKEVKAAAVINATGPWTDRTISMSQPLEGGSLLRPTKGSHIVVDHAKLPVENAIVCFHPDDGRVAFAIPWGDRTYIGTTDTDYEGDPAKVYATREDVDYLLDACRRYFPRHPLAHEDVICTWAGLRPLMRPAEASDDIDESSVSREHQIVVGADGLITIAGGKLTTYRRMSHEVVDTAVNLLRLCGKLPESLSDSATDKAPLPGAVGWPADDNHERVARKVSDVATALPAASARLLADTYGMRSIEIARLVRVNPELGEQLVAGRPEILAQVDWAVNEELAATVSDVMIRRTQLYYRDFEQGLSAAERVADRMASLLDWSTEQREASIAGYLAEVECSRAWRHEEPAAET
jgi:glycerol-3-phosphate dehydrogenase